MKEEFGSYSFLVQHPVSLTTEMIICQKCIEEMHMINDPITNGKANAE